MKKLGIILILLLIASVFISGCVSHTENVSNNGNGVQRASSIAELKIGYQPSIDHIAYMVADKKGWWKTDLAPYGVQDIKEYVFQTGPPEMQAMLAGYLDVAYVGAPPVIVALSQGLDAKIVGSVDINGSSLVLRPEYKYTGPQDLKGLKIAAFPPGSLQDTLIRKWLKKNGLDPAKDVTIVGMTAGDAISAISVKKIDAAFLPNPAPTRIEKEGTGRIIVQSGQMEPSHITNVLLVSGKLIRNHPDIVEQIVKTHINATKYAKENLDESAHIFSNKTLGDLETVKKSLKEWDGAWVSDPVPIETSTVDFANVLYGLNYTSKPLTKEDLFDTSFYEKAISVK